MERIAVGLVVVTMALVILFSVGVSIQSAEYVGRPSFLWESAREDSSVPKVDTDGDGIPDIDENYETGTNIHKKDSDGDGMSDLWETQWLARDPLTEQRIINPVDPTDAYEDPDNDGYDYNRNGYIDRFDDSVVMSELGVPPDADYDEKNINRLKLSPSLYEDTLVRLSGVNVMVNGSYATGGGEDVGKQNIIEVAEEATFNPNDYMTVVLQPNCNRPANLRAFNQTTGGQVLPGDRVDVQGILRHYGGATWLEVRGGEGFTNIMEYKARFYVGDPEVEEQKRVYNQTDPTDPDTDGDGISDGWEALFNDNDGDRIANWFELVYGLSPFDPDGVNGTDGDPDEDGYTNWQEFLNGTNPTDPDSNPGTEERGAPPMPPWHREDRLAEQRDEDP